MALIATTSSQIKAEKESRYQKMKKLAQNKDVVQYPLRIPAHIHTKLKTKLSSQRKNLRQFMMEKINEYLAEK